MTQDESIGIGFAEKGFPRESFPGWNTSALKKRSYGYHADDGIIRFLSDFEIEPYGPCWGIRDTVGACLDYHNHAIFFTKGTNFLGVAYKNFEDIDWYAVIGSSRGNAVSINFGQRPFVFNLRNHLDSEEYSVNLKEFKPRGQTEETELPDLEENPFNS